MALPVRDPIGSVAIQGGPGWRPREGERWWPGVSLAVGAHLALVLALAFAVSWKVQKAEVAVEAEVWSEIPRAAGPAVAPPPPPEPTPVPPDAPKPEPVPPQPAPEPEPKVVPKPDIVAEREPPKKNKPEHKPEPKLEPKPEKAKPEKPEKEKAAKDKPEKKRKEPKEVFDTSPPKPSPKPEAKPKAESAQSAAEREALRQAHLARMMSDLGGGPGGAGRASASSGPSKSYIGRLIARIKPNVVFTETVNGNPMAQVEVRCAPDGRIVSRKLVAASGVAAWDDAVLRALDRTEVLPADEQGRVPPVMLLDFRPKDF